MCSFIFKIVVGVEVKEVSAGLCARSSCCYEGKKDQGHRRAATHRRHLGGEPLLLVGSRASLVLESHTQSNAESALLFKIVLI